MATDHDHRSLPSLTDIFDIIDDGDDGDHSEGEYEQDFDFDYIHTNVDDEEMMEEDLVEDIPTVIMIRAARCQVETHLFTYPGLQSTGAITKAQSTVDSRCV